MLQKIRMTDLDTGDRGYTLVECSDAQAVAQMDELIEFVIEGVKREHQRRVRVDVVMNALTEEVFYQREQNDN